MAIAEMLRDDHRVQAATFISSNRELLDVLRSNETRRLYLFRAGLIINRKLLQTEIDICNIHCATLPAFGGLAAIPRALRSKAYAQAAVLHQVTERIDCGTVIRQVPYELDPHRSYGANEDIAYEAGIRLLLDELENSSRLDRSLNDLTAA